MNREFKFRAWDDKNKKWLLGYEKPNLGGFSLTGECVISVEWGNIISEFLFGFHEKSYADLKIMQFTGLKDKNGVDIYEGDIIKSGTNSYLFGYNAIIVFNDCTSVGDNSCNYVGFKAKLISENNRNRVVTKINSLKCEIIGNIYENPELL